MSHVNKPILLGKRIETITIDCWITVLDSEVEPFHVLASVHQYVTVLCCPSPAVGGQAPPLLLSAVPVDLSGRLLALPP